MIENATYLYIKLGSASQKVSGQRIKKLMQSRKQTIQIYNV